MSPTSNNCPTTKKVQSHCTELHYIITHVEETVENKDITVEVFLDAEGAFDSTSHNIIIEAEKGMDLMTVCW
jgi:uncharacterized Fe-S cluster-containing radical SAM superfamily enzyme